MYHDNGNNVNEHITREFQCSSAWIRIDDPIAWGVLPFRYHWDANNSRYSLGSHDICFKQGCV
jgi:hypothetical protein